MKFEYEFLANNVHNQNRHQNTPSYLHRIRSTADLTHQTMQKTKQCQVERWDYI